VFALLTASLAQAQNTTELPREWIDPDTGHRVVRLSDEPGSQSLYFHQNAYTPDGTKLIISTPTGLSTVDLKTHHIQKVVEGRVNLLTTGRKTGDAYYVKDGTVYAIDLNKHATREIGKLPPHASVTNVNADETLLVGAITEGQVQNPVTPVGPRRDSYPEKGAMMEQRLAARLPMQLYTLNIKTGEVKTIHRSTDWLNHIQFSPTDPTLIMFCHE
jgi:oligogalacturonide lyase